MVEEDSLTGGKEPHHNTIGTGGRCLTQHISLKNYLIVTANKTNKQTNKKYYIQESFKFIIIKYCKSECHSYFVLHADVWYAESHFNQNATCSMQSPCKAMSMLD
jgi:hypothetical protein